MAFDKEMFAGGAGAALGPALSYLFGNWKDPTKKAMPYLEGMEDKMSPYFNPWINAGKEQIPGLEKQFGDLTNDPGGFINRLGQGYKQSPGFDFALKRALGGANQAAAAGGMAGSPQAMEWSENIGTDLASKDFNNWLKNALGAYGTGLEGQEKLFGTGAEMGKDFGQSLGNVELQKALLKYMGQNAENQREGSMWGAFGEAIPSIAAAFL